MTDQMRAERTEGISPDSLVSGGFSATLQPVEEHPTLGVGDREAAKGRPRKGSVRSSDGEAHGAHLAPVQDSESVQETAREAPLEEFFEGEVAVPEDREFSVLTTPVRELEGRLQLQEEIRPTQWYRRALRMKADARTVRRFEQEQSMRAMLPRPVTMVLAQPTGDAGKTCTAIGMASALADARGGDVIAIDNHDSRGTLADRVEKTHSRDMADLLAHLGWFLKDETANSLAVDWLCQRQLSGVKVLGSDQELKVNRAGISAEQYTKLHQVVTRYNPIAVVDTGQTEVAPNWLAAMATADVIVVPIRMRDDYILPAARMLRGLQSRGHELTNRVIIVVTNGAMKVRDESGQIAAEYFGAFPRVDIPFDPEIDSEGPIRWDRLQEKTREAYRELGALALTKAIANANATRVG